MKPRVTLILLGVFAVLLAAVLFFESRGKKEAAVKEKEGYLVDVAAADIRKIEVKKEDGDIVLEKDDKGDWRVTAPLQAKADAAEANGLAESFGKLRIDRVVEKEAKDLKTYDIPKRQVLLWVKGKDAPVTVLVGMENPLDNALFAKRAGDPRVVLISSSLKSTLDKKLFDYREKDVFKFDTAEAKSVRVEAGKVTWWAVRADGGWRFEAPVKALAEKSKIDSLVDALSTLKAKEFVSEDKSPADVKKFGLEKPEFEVTLSLPAANKDIVFAVHKEGDKTYAMTSEANKIILFEGTLTTDLERKVEDLRDKKTSDFTSWEAAKVTVRNGAFTLTAAKEKVKDEETWVLQTPAKDPADGPKIDAFLRKIESLEAAGFVDNPGSPAGYGLDKPAAEIHVWTKDAEGKLKETALAVGKEDAAKKQVFVRNAKLDYLFLVDPAFLQDLPKDAKDWKPEPAKPEEPAPVKK